MLWEKNKAGEEERKHLGAEWWEEVTILHLSGVRWRLLPAARVALLREVLSLAVMMKESKLTKFQQRHIMDTMKSKGQRGSGPPF